MNGAASAHDPWSALRQRDFRLYAGTRMLANGGMTLQQAAILWQVYHISNSALQLGLIGLVRFAPSLGLSLLGGAVADTYDRRRLVIATQAVPLLSSAALFLATRSGSAQLPLIYALVFLLSLAAAFESPARQALLPQLVTRDTFPNAVAVSSTLNQLGTVGGPAIGGLLIATGGVSAAYLAHVILVVIATAGLLPVRPRPETGARRAVSISAIREGVQFVIHRQAILGAMTLDMFAVVFGGATALLPLYAQDILHVGAAGYGLLVSSQSVGALAMSVILVACPPVRQVGKTLILAVAAFGVATAVFGASRWFPLSLLAFALTGVADEVSVIMRQTTIQLATPDALRGRVSSVSSIFIGASNQVGAMESGFVAAITSATFSVVSGGLAALGVVGIVAAAMPDLRGYRIGADAGAKQLASPAAGATVHEESPTTPVGDVSSVDA